MSALGLLLALLHFSFDGGAKRSHCCILYCASQMSIFHVRISEQTFWILLGWSWNPQEEYKMDSTRYSCASPLFYLSIWSMRQPYYTSFAVKPVQSLYQRWVFLKWITAEINWSVDIMICPSGSLSMRPQNVVCTPNIHLSSDAHNTRSLTKDCFILLKFWDQLVDSGGVEGPAGLGYASTLNLFGLHTRAVKRLLQLR